MSVVRACGDLVSRPRLVSGTAERVLGWGDERVQLSIHKLGGSRGMLHTENLKMPCRFCDGSVVWNGYVRNENQISSGENTVWTKLAKIGDWGKGCVRCPRIFSPWGHDCPQIWTRALAVTRTITAQLGTVCFSILAGECGRGDSSGGISFWRPTRLDLKTNVCWMDDNTRCIMVESTTVKRSQCLIDSHSRARKACVSTLPASTGSHVTYQVFVQAWPSDWKGVRLADKLRII